MYYISNFIRDRDSIQQRSVFRLHFNKDLRIKTICGGVLSTIFQLVVLSILVSRCVRLFSFSDPKIAQTESELEDATEKVYLKDVPATMLEIWGGANILSDHRASHDHFFQRVKLGRDSRSYISIKVHNVINKSDHTHGGK